MCLIDRNLFIINLFQTRILYVGAVPIMEQFLGTWFQDSMISDKKKSILIHDLSFQNKNEKNIAILLIVSQNYSSNS